MPIQAPGHCVFQVVCCKPEDKVVQRAEHMDKLTACITVSPCDFKHKVREGAPTLVVESFEKSVQKFDVRGLVPKMGDAVNEILGWSGAKTIALPRLRHNPVQALSLAGHLASPLPIAICTAPAVAPIVGGLVGEISSPPGAFSQCRLHCQLVGG